MVYYVKLIGLVAILAVLLFYALPKAFGALWFLKPREDKIHDQNYRAPLRVEYLHSKTIHT